MTDLARAQILQNHAVVVATRAAVLADALDAPLADLRARRDVSYDVTIAALEGLQEFYRMTSAHLTLVETVGHQDTAPPSFVARLRWLFTGG